MELFYKALLGKWKWRIFIDINSLCVRVVESKYGKVGERGKLHFFFEGYDSLVVVVDNL